jgi:hypothetical protein
MHGASTATAVMMVFRFMAAAMKLLSNYVEGTAQKILN